MGTRGAALGLALVVLAACEDRRPAAVAVPPAAPAFRASCTLPVLGVCVEYTDDAFALGESLVRAACTGSQGTWSPARCPPERCLGRCATDGATRHYYPTGPHPFTAASAALDCAELHQGSWAAPEVHPQPKESNR